MNFHKKNSFKYSDILESQIIEKNRKKSAVSATSNIEKFAYENNNNTNANILKKILENIENLNKKTDNTCSLIQQKLLFPSKSFYSQSKFSS